MFKHMCSAKVLYMDGTFKCTPTYFAQIYTIHCQVYGVIFPVIYGVPPKQTKETYENFLQLIVSTWLILFSSHMMLP